MKLLKGRKWVEFGSATPRCVVSLSYSGMEFISGPGQPRLQLWQFLLEVLNKEEFGSIIRWTNVEPGEFKVIETEEVARLWGLRKGRPNMNYDKLSRSLR